MIKRNSGFTLVELLSIVVAVAVFSTIAMVLYHFIAKFW
jgi:Tfp pilus assembly protein PilE